MQVAARTEVGHVRARNEDALLVAGEDGLVAVFDGLGGHPAGDVASATAAASLRESGLTAASSAEDLVAALQAAHDAVGAAADGDPDRTGMATTAVVATLGGSTALVAHVGDSRAYLRDGDGRLEQVTRDHGMGGYITQALGLDRGVEPGRGRAGHPAGVPAAAVLGRPVEHGRRRRHRRPAGRGGRDGRLRRAGRGRPGPRRHRQRDRGGRDLLAAALASACREAARARPARPAPAGKIAAGGLTRPAPTWPVPATLPAMPVLMCGRIPVRTTMVTSMPGRRAAEAPAPGSGTPGSRPA